MFTTSLRPRAKAKLYLVIALVLLVLLPLGYVVVQQQNSSSPDSKTEAQPATANSSDKETTGLSEAQKTTTAVEGFRTQSSPEASPSKTYIIEGRLTFDDRVSSTTLPTVEFLQGARTGYFIPQTNFEILKTTTANADGTYAFEFPSTEDVPLNTPTMVRVTCTGFCTTAMVLLPKERTQFEVLKNQGIRLLQPATVSGRVQDPERNPIAGATVGAELLPIHQHEADRESSWNNYGFLQQMFISATTVSSADGTFELVGIPDIEPWEMPIPGFAEGYAPGLSQRISPGDTNALITLRPANATLQGRITFANGEPLENINIDLRFLENAEPNHFSDMTLSSTRSDAEGRFELRNQAAGTHAINAYPDYPEFRNKIFFERVQLQSNQTTEYNIVLPTPVRITGTVTNEFTGEPIANVQIAEEVVNFTTFQKARNIVSTAANGTYTIQVQPWRPEFVFFAATPEGYVKENDQLVKVLFVEELPKVGETVIKDITFKPTIGLRGRVLLADGVTPAEGAEFEVQPQLGAEQTYYSRTTTKTDAEGFYTLNFPANQGGVATIEHVTGWGSLVFPKDATSLPDVILQPFGSILVEVKFPEGVEPQIVGFALNGFVGSDIPEGVRVEGNRFYNVGATSLPTFQYQIGSKPNPTFVFERLPAGKYSLSVAPWQGEVSFIPEEVNNILVSSGERTQGIIINLKPGDFIEGRVVDSEGKPLPDSSIEYSMRYNSTTQKSDAKGNFKISGLAENQTIPYLQVSKEGYEPQFLQSVSFLQSPLTITLKKLGESELQVVDAASGKPIPNFSYMRYQDAWGNNPQSDSMVLVNHPEGKFSLGEIPNRPIKVNVLELTASGNPTGRKGAARFSAEDAAKGVVKIPVSQPFSASGRVLNSQGEPVKDAIVGFLPDNQNNRGAGFDLQNWKILDATLQIEPQTTNAKGEFTLTGIPMGSYGLRAEKDGLKSLNTDLEIVAGDVDGIELTLQSPASIFGTVTGRDGKPINNGIISVNNYSTSFESEVKTDAKGMYE
ncbi:MAG: carboxypeptidase-like regulatory domain-containing protein, partial [Candidatus Sumerlaeia bacterium]|nr:carboxypeptidase-like regulatory domain-containing protein [Candidatus Sumerlaeia bacterium]